MKNDETADIVIVGGGFTGMTLALALKAGGFDPILLDKAKPENHLKKGEDGRAFALAPASLDLYQTLGLREKLLSFCEPVQHILTSDGHVQDDLGLKSSGPFSLHFSAREEGRDKAGALGFMIETYNLHKILTEQIAHARIHRLAPAHMIGMTPTPSSIQCHLEDGRRIETSLLLAADGRSSRVRRQAGFSTHSWSYHQRAFVTTLKHEYDHQGVAYEHCLPSGTFALLPLQGRRSSLVWAEKEDGAAALEALGEEVFSEELRRRMGNILGKVEVIAPLRHYPLGFQIAERYYTSRLALVGDAAHSVHPLAGQGFNLGLRDIDALVNILTQARRLGEDYGSPSVLRRYEQERRLDNLVMGLSLDAFNRFFSNNNKILRFARRTGLGLVDHLGPLRHFFERAASGPRRENLPH